MNINVIHLLSCFSWLYSVLHLITPGTRWMVQHLYWTATSTFQAGLVSYLLSIYVINILQLCYQIKHFEEECHPENPKWVKARRNYHETVIFRLYFKVIIRQYVLSFCLMMTLKYYSFIIVPGLVLNHILGFHYDILRNMFHFIFFQVVGWFWFLVETTTIRVVL